MASREPFGTKAAMAYADSSQARRCAERRRRHLDGRLPHGSHLVLKGQTHFEASLARRETLAPLCLKESLGSCERLRAILGLPEIRESVSQSEAESFQAEKKQRFGRRTGAALEAMVSMAARLTSAMACSGSASAFELAASCCGE